MKTSFVAIALALVYLMSFVIADHQPNAVVADHQPSNVGVSANDSSDANASADDSSDLASDQDDQAVTTASDLRGPRPLGVVSTRINAKNNTLVIKNSNIFLSKDDLKVLAKTIHKMLSNKKEAGVAASMTTEDLVGLLAAMAANPAAMSNAVGIVSAAKSGDTSALAGHVVGLLGAALPPPAAETPAPDASAPMSEVGLQHTFSAAIALAFIYLVSFVIADHQPRTMTLSNDDSSDLSLTQSGLRGHSAVGLVTNTITANDNNVFVKNSNILLSKSDRVQLAKTIKEMLASNPDAASISTEGLVDFLTRVATTPGALTHAAGIISAARSGNTGALAGHVVGLLSAALPPATPAPTVPQPAPIAPIAPISPMVPPMSIPIATAAAPSIPVAPIYATAPVSPQVAPAAAMTPPEVPTTSA
ncbi:hypothetical protein P3T76_003011 [Phytophthora citrophthora]|uniref:RxLR effector protein n=1 Tax=Phytophthora citrophthora TaxID=4793 RepID=A0AAD9GXP0_9STRA|nr:hypothetical protein P3T76_003011 [Phytophthora citrophthora]